MEEPVFLLLIQKTFNTGPINCNILSKFNMSHAHKKKSFKNTPGKLNMTDHLMGMKRYPTCPVNEL
jgi:hypothetical protein